MPDINNAIKKQMMHQSIISGVDGNFSLAPNVVNKTSKNCSKFNQLFLMLFFIDIIYISKDKTYFLLFLRLVILSDQIELIEMF